MGATAFFATVSIACANEYPAFSALDSSVSVSPSWELNFFRRWLTRYFT